MTIFDLLVQLHVSNVVEHEGNISRKVSTLNTRGHSWHVPPQDPLSASRLHSAGRGRHRGNEERSETARENEISVWETAYFIQFSPEGSKVRILMK